MMSLAACGGNGGVPAAGGSSSAGGASGANAFTAPVRGSAFYYAPNVRRACAVAQKPDEMACLALVRTDVPATTPAGYGPSDLQSAYNLPSTTDGQGQTVAVVDAYDNPNAESDLAVYRSTYGLPACGSSNSCFRKVNELGETSNYPTPNSGWALEESLDVDMVSAICPKCHIVLVEANTNSGLDLGKSVNTAADVIHADAISNSYIGYHAHSKGGRLFYEHPGHIITAAGGDDGYKIGEPAGFPTVVAVGGTQLTRTTTGRMWAEVVWAGTGSGCVLTRTKPKWQGRDACSWRSMNDVAADAAPGTGVAYYDTYDHDGWGVVGGTSVASPIIASVYALAGNEKRMHAAESLYAQGASLYDVTSGSNGTKCKASHHILCNAGPGWDGPTGNGTPNGISAF
jgi:subtilase family serine protease